MENALRTGGKTHRSRAKSMRSENSLFFHEGETKLLDSVSWPTSFANFACSNIRC